MGRVLPRSWLAHRQLRRHGQADRNAQGGAWQHQIDAVVAGRVDATMVEQGIWLGKPANAAATKIVGSVDRLPGPVIVSATSVDPAFASAFLTKLLACRTAAPAQPFLGYTGFAPMWCRRSSIGASARSPLRRASVPFPTFVSSRGIRLYERRKQRDTSKS
jgi:hypothetical protein